MSDVPKRKRKFPPKDRESNAKCTSDKKSRKSYKLRDTEEGTNSRISNDPNWYFTDAKTADLVSGISFNQFLGNSFVLSTAIPSEFKVPTISVQYMNPSAGWVSPVNPRISGINMNGFRIFTQLSSKNAKTTSYAPQDVTILILALGSMLEFVSYIRRFFGFYNTYNVRNRTFIKILFGAMGLDCDDFVSGIADYRAEFNNLLTMIGQIPFPRNITYFDKCMCMYDEIYSDALIDMAQMYVNVPESIWVFDEAYNEQGSGLSSVTVNVPGQKSTMALLLSHLRTQIEALLTSTTLNYVYSDVLNYASKSEVKMIGVDLVFDNYTKVPVYSENFLLQIKNSTIIGSPLAASAIVGDVSQYTPSNDVCCTVNDNCIRYNPQFKFLFPGMALDAILDFKVDHPDVTMRIEATRFTVRGETSLFEGNYYSTSLSLPDHYITKILLYKNVDTAEATLSTSFVATSAATLATISQFGDFPSLYLFNTPNKDFSTVFGDLHYFTTVSAHYLQMVDDICTMGLFALR